MRRGRAILLVALGILAMTVVAWLFLSLEPSYAGRTLSGWVADFEGRPQIYFSWKPAAVSATSPASTNAVRQLGTKATPFLVDWLAYRQPAWKTNLLRRANRVWETFGVTNRFLDKKLERADRTVPALAAIEVLSDQVIVRLVALMSDPDRRVRDRARRAVANAGGVSVRALVILMTNSSAMTRENAVIDLGNRKDLHLAVHALIDRLNDPSPRVAEWAAIRLGDIDSAPALVLPALTNALQHSTPAVRSAAACALGNFGTVARPMASALLRIQDDSDPTVRISVHSALQALERSGD